MTTKLGLKTSNQKTGAIEWLQARQRGLTIESSSGDGPRPKHRLTTGLCYDRGRLLDDILRKLYRNLSAGPIKDTSFQSGFGSIYNLEFSPDGRVVVAACERRAMALFDPLTSRTICSVQNAHTDCVNCITFFDSRTFASGSDDNTIALWDIRNLKSKVRSFQGHTNWVKSIEYCPPSQLMISSAFDDNVLLWDINKYDAQTNEPLYDSLLNLATLMRMRITPDGTKMILSSSSSMYVIIHDLSLAHLADDMEGISNYVHADAIEDRQHAQIFYRKRNRVEIVNDFPNSSVGEDFSISSLVIHPQGWCMISRLSTDNDNVEYTCVHDIQENIATIASCEEGHEFFQYHGYNNPLKHERLLYHINEPSDGKGYIKELSMNPEGNLICSSFGYGVRLLAFDTGISELCDLQPSSPDILHEVKSIFSHRQTVLTSAFSPNQCLLVSGCLNGRVVFYHPTL